MSSSSSSSSPPRVAVIGGGITGTLCSLALQHRGVIPTVIEQGRRFGGRLSSPGGAQWLRASTLPLAALYESLRRQGLLWSNNNNNNNKNERFGVLGSAGGGFLPQTQIPQPRLHENRTNNKNNNNKSVAAMMDSGDFCHFIEGSAAPTFGGNLETLCGTLLERSQIDAVSHTTVLGATAAPDGWHLEMQKTNTHDDGHHHDASNEATTTTTSAQFDGLVIATHNASLAASIVQGIATSELAAGTASTAPVLQKLTRLTKDLHAVRQSKIPVFTLQFMLDNNNDNSNDNNNNDDAIPFDAVTVPGSHLIQFLSRRDKIWTAVSTSQFARDLLSQSNSNSNDNDNYNDQALLNQQAEQALTAEVQRLLAPFVTTTTTLFPMTHTTVKCWPAAFSGQALLCAQDDCIVLQPWRLTIAGDYIIRRRGDDNTTTTPLEAAATSGLAAGEQTASYFAHTNSWSSPQE